MQHPNPPANARPSKTSQTVWFVILAGLLTSAALLSLANPLASPAIALGQAAGNEALSTGRFEAIQVGTATATVILPTTSPPSGPTILPYTPGPGITALPGETATPTLTGPSGSPAVHENSAPAARPTATEAGFGISPTSATPPLSASDTAIPPIEPTLQATKSPAPVIGPTSDKVPTQRQPTGPPRDDTARPGSPAAPMTPGISPTSSGSGSSPILLCLGGILIVGIGILAYFIGRRG